MKKHKRNISTLQDLIYKFATINNNKKNKTTARVHVTYAHKTTQKRFCFVKKKRFQKKKPKKINMILVTQTHRATYPIDHEFEIHY